MTYVYLLIFVFIDPGNITIPSIHIKVASFIVYPNFWDEALSKIQILYNICIYIYVYIYIYIYIPVYIYI